MHDIHEIVRCLIQFWNKGRPAEAGRFLVRTCQTSSMNLPSFNSPVVLHWFRRDLRWQDNRALHAALTSGHNVLPVFVFDRNILGKLEAKEDARVTFLHNRMRTLKDDALKRSSDILVVHSDPIEVLTALAKDPNVLALYTNEDYEPYAQDRDNKVRETFEGLGKAFHSFTDHVIQAPGEVKKPDGSPYTVFTPFSKRWHANLTEDNMAQAPSEMHLNALHAWTAPEMPSLEAMGFTRSSISAPEAHIAPTTLKAYADMRDVPSKPGTTRISVHLRFGTISIREAGVQAQRKWLTELIWRDFYQAIMHAFPHSMTDAFRPKYDKVPEAR